MCSCPRCRACRKNAGSAQTGKKASSFPEASSQSTARESPACGACCPIPNRSFWPSFALPRSLRGQKALLLP